jgi:hypothetical protein
MPMLALIPEWTHVADFNCTIAEDENFHWRNRLQLTQVGQLIAAPGFKFASVSTSEATDYIVRLFGNLYVERIRPKVIDQLHTFTLECPTRCDHYLATHALRACNSSVKNWPNCRLQSLAVLGLRPNLQHQPSVTFNVTLADPCV